MESRTDPSHAKMEPSYLLRRLIVTGRAMRKAQIENAANRNDPKKDNMKKALMSEKYRREEDYDQCLAQVEKVFPVPAE